MASSSLQRQQQQSSETTCNHNAVDSSSDPQPRSQSDIASSSTTSLLLARHLNQQNVTQNSTVQWRFHRQQPSNADNNNLLDLESTFLFNLFNDYFSQTRLHPLDTSKHLRPDSPGTELRIQTDVAPGSNFTAISGLQRSPASPRRLSKAKSIPSACIPSTKKTFVPSSVSSAASSVISSPMLSAMSDVTPLPSPLLSSDSPGPWRKFISRPTSRDDMLPSADPALVAANGESINSALVNAQKRRHYHGLINADCNLSKEIRGKNAEENSRSRSISEYMPEAMTVNRQRHVTISGSQSLDSAVKDIESDSQMRREPHLAAQRGLEATDPLTPPQDSHELLSIPESMASEQHPRYDYFEARSRSDNKKRRWRAVRLLGEGTFSKVMLATNQTPAECEQVDGKTERTDLDSIELDPRKLVAIKICEHGPKGGASEERVEVSLKRELDFLRSVHHPSLVNLKAWSVEETRAILVLNYCPGGDLFDVASQHSEILVPSLLQRIFSELVGAVRYLHECHIVHRDIKLENILVNVTIEEFTKPDMDWRTYPYSIITLTDLGLSRRITDDEKLMTRCGSDDYAAPEVIMGQSYDGRMVDAWSLGVVLYALIERRLPFDPPPNASANFKQRSKTSHRIARVEWRWIEFHGDEGDHEADVDKFEKAGLLGAMRCTEMLLKKARTRVALDALSGDEWVREGVCVEGGIRFRDEDVGDCDGGGV